MARTPATNYSSPGYSYATADTDAFDRTDVSGLGQSVDGHDHSSGKGLPITIPSGTITSAMIADGTIQGADIATGAITTTQIQDGTIATADLANNAVTNAKLGTDTARLNLLTNGGMEVWQRGAGAFSANSAWTTDRWQIQLGGADTMSVSRDTANANGSGQYCAAVTFTGSTGSNLAQVLGADSQLVRGRIVTWSAQVKTSTANAVRLQITDNVAATQSSSFHTGSGQYETLSLTYTVTNSASVSLYTLFRFTASCTAYIDNAMLVVGSVAADYAPLHPADDLARCLRYYEVVGDGYPYPAIAGYNTAGGAVYTGVAFLVRKAVSPTATKNGTWNVSNIGQPGIVAQMPTGMMMSATITATGVGVVTPSAAGQNVTLEANP